MDELLNKQGTAVNERSNALVVELLPKGNGSNGMILTKNLDIAKLVTNEQRIEEEKFLENKEEQIRNRYRGIKRYFRLLEIVRVISTLSLYLYLDQLDVHQKQQRRHKKERLVRAYRLTRLAVYGEKLYAIRVWFFQQFMKLVRFFVIGAERNRERNQEKQAVWLKEKLIELGPTFIKIGQAMATRADLLPLPFVVELGTLVDQVPPFPNEIAFARIEHELGKKINEVYSEFELDPVAAASL